MINLKLGQEKEFESWMKILDSSQFRHQPYLCSPDGTRLDMIVEPDEIEEKAYKKREEKYHRFKRIEYPDSLYL